MINRFGALVCLLFLTFTFSAKAEPLIFTFQIEGFSLGAGTINGVLYGLEDNTTGLPTQVILNSVNSPILTVSSDLLFTNVTDGFGFTVSNGQIIAADMAIFTPDMLYALGFNSDGFNTVGKNEGTNPVVGNGFGFAGATYFHVAPLPEPSTYVLLGLGLGALIAVRRFKKA